MLNDFFLKLFSTDEKLNENYLQKPPTLQNKCSDDVFCGVDFQATFSQNFDHPFSKEKGKISSCFHYFSHFSSEKKLKKKDDDKDEVLNELEKLNKKIFNVNKQVTGISEDIKQFSEEIKNLGTRYLKWKHNFAEYGNFQNNFLSVFEYFNVNQENIQTYLEHRVSYENLESLKSHLNDADTAYKLTSFLAPLIFNIVKFSINYQIRSELDEFKKRYHVLKKKVLKKKPAPSFFSVKMNRIKKAIEEININLEQDSSEAKYKGLSKLENIICKLTTFSLSKMGIFGYNEANKICKNVTSIIKESMGLFSAIEMSQMQKKWLFKLQPRIIVDINIKSNNQEKLYQKVDNFLFTLEKCNSLKKVKKELKKVNINLRLPSEFEDWLALYQKKEFQRELIQNFYCFLGTKPHMSGAFIQKILEKRKKTEKIKKQQSLNFIYQQIKEVENLEFSEIESHFKKIHIYLDQIKLSNSPLQLPPKNKNDWNTCVKDQQFCFSLASQWVDYQETSGQLFLQGLRQTLISKNNIEKKFFIFRGIEFCLSITSSILQLILILPQIQLWTLASIIEVFFIDLGKFGFPFINLAHLFHPLYPEMSFKLDNLMILLVEHFFALKYKPNEYSLEGYKLSLQIRWIEFVVVVNYFVSLLQQTLLWIHIRIIENCLLRRGKKPYEEDNRYIEVNNKLERQRLNCKQRIRDLNDCLDQLKEEDLKLAINPYYNKNEKNKFEPIHNLTEMIHDVNVDYFPNEFHEFFEENFGFKLTESNKSRFKEKVLKFLIENENKFIRSFETNSMDYLKHNHSYGS